MQAETSASIATWAEATFGQVGDLRVLVRRARQELDELEAALGEGATAEALTESADVVILLHRLAHLLGGDLAIATDQKMAVNRARRWTRTGDGVGKHIPSDKE